MKTAKAINSDVMDLADLEDDLVPVSFDKFQQELAHRGLKENPDSIKDMENWNRNLGYDSEVPEDGEVHSFFEQAVSR